MYELLKVPLIVLAVLIFLILVQNSKQDRNSELIALRQVRLSELNG